MKRIASVQGYVAAFLVMLLAVPPAVLAQRTKVQPGWNMISVEQEVQLGREAVAEVERQVPLARDSAINNYVSELGQRLARHAPGTRYPYTFKVVADNKINAFALPGGPVYINTGVLNAAQNEAQVAGVMAHEIAHIALRHGTSNASKAMIAQMPLAILGGIIGSGSVLGQLAQLGIGFGLNSVFLKYSRDAERQADILGSQMLYDVGYDPEEMAKFFEAMTKSERSRSVEWLSSHPSPGNRVELVRGEIKKLGPQKTLVDYGPRFNEIKSRVGGVQTSTARPGYGHDPAGQHTHPNYPSGQFRTLNAGPFRIAFPDNWQAYGEGTGALTIAPPEGIVRSGNTSGIAYGAIISFHDADDRASLNTATSDLIEQLRHSNPDLRVMTGRQRINLDNREGLSVFMRGRSPVRGENEMDWLVTTLGRDGTLWYAVFVAPERDFSSMRPTFERMLDSVQFTGF